MAFKLPPWILANPVYSHIIRQVYWKHGNYIILVTGLPRTGKSRLSLRLAYDLDINQKGQRLFKVENVCPTARDFLEKVTKGTRDGEVFIWEEAGFTANSRNFAKQANVLMAQIFHILGFKHQIAIINLPMSFMLDKQIRSLIHCEMETQYLSIEEKKCTVKVVFNKILTEKDKKVLVGKYPRLLRDGEPLQVISMKFGLPPEELDSEYEEIMDKQKQDWMEETIEKLKQNDLDKFQETVEGVSATESIEEILHRVQAQPEKFWDLRKNKADTYLLRAKVKRANGKPLSLPDANAVAHLWNSEYQNGEWAPK